MRAADADPAIVLLGGEAGVGKTRLVAELTARCTTNGMRVLYGGCVPVGEGALPYAPIVEALRTLLAEAGGAAVRELVTRATLVRRVVGRWQTPGAGELGVPVGARLRRTPLRRVVDVDEPEALGVAEGPLEVVAERPLEEPADVDALLDRAVHRTQVGVD